MYSWPDNNDLIWPGPQLVLALGTPDAGVGGEGTKLCCVSAGTGSPGGVLKFTYLFISQNLKLCLI